MRFFVSRKMAMVLAPMMITLGALALNMISNTAALANDNRAVVHQSILKLSHGDLAALSNRNIKVGLNKSIIIELPNEVRDVLVSNPKIVDAVVHTARRAYLIGKKSGEANAFFFDKAGKRILTLEINVSRDMTSLRNVLERLFDKSQIDVDTVDDRIILTGSVERPADAIKAVKIAQRFTDDENKVINLLSVVGNEQVMLKVTIAEIERNVARQIGINLEKMAQSGNIAVTSLRDMVFNYTGSLSETNSQASIGWTSGANSVSAAIKAMEDNGLIRTLAEPNITAISGETASFLAGGEFPIPFSDSDGEVTVTFKKFGVGLAFTPVVLDRNRISLKIDTEVSELSNRGSVTIGGISIPGIKVRRALSTVEVPSGGSVVMAGLISDTTKTGINDVPGLKKLPVLGALFRSRDFVRQETEMVVIVTPYLVKPVNSPRKLARPDQAIDVASTKDAFWHGHLNRKPMRSSWPVQEVAPAGLKDRGYKDRGSYTVTNSIKPSGPRAGTRRAGAALKARPIKRRLTPQKSIFGFIVE